MPLFDISELNDGKILGCIPNKITQKFTRPKLSTFHRWMNQPRFKECAITTNNLNQLSVGCVPFHANIIVNIVQFSELLFSVKDIPDDKIDILIHSLPSI